MQSLATGILIHYKTDFTGSWCRVSSIFVLVFYTSLNSRGYKIKLKTTFYTAVSIDIDAYYWDTQDVATFLFLWCQMPGGGGGMGTLGFDSYISFEFSFATHSVSTIIKS